MTIDPEPRCYWCDRLMSEIAAHGCGSQEIQGERAQERVNALCEVYQKARRGIASGGVS